MRLRSIGFVVGVALTIGLLGWAEAAEVAAKPKARANRLAISLGVGVGSASMSSYHDFTGDLSKAVESVNPGLKIDEVTSNFQVNGEFSVRYYFPYYVLGQVGYGAIYNWASTDIGNSTIEYHNILMEVPILAGGYYTLIDRIYLFGALGPSVFFFSRSYWDSEQGAPADYKASSGVGFTALAGGDFMINNNLAFGLELRYRFLKAKDLVELKSGGAIGEKVGVVGTNGQARIGEPGESWDLDFSGISVGFFIRLFAL